MFKMPLKLTKTKTPPPPPPGGKFNRTAKVTFTFADRADQVVRLTQVFSGHDIHDKILMETTIEGDMPDIAADQVVTIDEYYENYKRTAPGGLLYHSF